MLSPSPRCSPAVGDAAPAPVQPVPHQQGEENPAGLGLRVWTAEGGCCSALHQGLLQGQLWSPLIPAAKLCSDALHHETQSLADSTCPLPARS